ncbi:hypothetical protein NQ314_011736 [Rhamnusium bicolor]|uniref:Uncharacterized protein n=1 Tax=Rhamnusium bicolor TaxID=1586634 RepID=A0AAV8XI24_9CUCU|nr:hypothetical protein NQ314_011736 [Rhamnusium bicolor]
MLKYDPSDPKDAKELLNYLDSLDSDDEHYKEVEEAEALELVLLPPSDGQDSDQDDAASDGEVIPTIRDIGKGVLAQYMEILTISKHGEKQLFREATRNKSEEENDSDSDLETLAEIRKRLKLSKNKKKNKKEKKPDRIWKKVDLTPFNTKK